MHGFGAFLSVLICETAGVRRLYLNWSKAGNEFVVIWRSSDFVDGKGVGEGVVKASWAISDVVLAFPCHLYR